MNKFTLKSFRPLAVIGAATVATASQAAIDVSSVVTEVAGTAAPIALIGGAVLLIMVGIAAYKWVRRAM